MASESQIETAIETLKEQIERSGYELDEIYQFEQETEEELLEIHRINFEYGGNRVLVQGAPGYYYFTVFFAYNISKVIGNSLEEEQAQALTTESEDIDNEEELMSEAAMELLRRIDSKQLAHLDYELSTRLTSPLTGYEIWRDENGVIYGFHVEKRIFPFEDDYSLYQFDEAVQAVVSQGVNGHKFLDRVFNIDLPEGESATDIDLTVGLPDSTPQTE